MSPKEKAEELYWKYFQLVADGSHPEENAKECALIAVDEILNVIHAKDLNYRNVYAYFLEVKQEIEKL